MSYIQPPLFYTEEEVSAKLGELTARLVTATEQDVVNATHSLKLKHESLILGVMKDQIREGSMDTDNATDLYNRIAQACGFDTVDSIAITYTVTVSYYGDDLIVVENVEANSAEEAEEGVLQDIELDEFEINFTIRSGNVSEGASISDDYRLGVEQSVLQDLSASAEEE